MSLNHNGLGSDLPTNICERAGKYPTLLNEFENDIFLGGLCSSQNNSSLWKKALFVQRSKAYPGNNTPTSLKTMFLNSLTFFKPQAYNSYFLKPFNSLNSQITIKLNQRKLNRLNFIQKRRSKIQPLLRITSQKIYSLNKFQIALCFSKILQPSILFNNESFSNLSEKVDNSMFDNSKNESELQTQVEKYEDPSYFSPIGVSKKSTSGAPPVGFQQGAKQWGESEALEAEFLNDVAFTKPNQKINDIEFHPIASQSLAGDMKPQTEPNNYNLRRKDWYMKTGFFQHIAWNMKHKVLNQFSNIELLFDIDSLPIKNCDNFVIKPFQINSYQKQSDFSTTNDIESKKKKQGSNLIPFLTQAKTSNQLKPTSKLPISVDLLHTNTTTPVNEFFTSLIEETRNKNNNFLINHKNFKSILPNNFFKMAQKDLFCKPYNYKFCKNSNLIIYGGSWYYENLAFPFTIFNRVPVTKLLYRNKNALAPIYFNNRSSYKGNFALSEKVQKELESNIGIYSLAHKLSSIGFQNGYTEGDIYPFKYNDSYRYNFQNMNLSNSRLKSFFTEQDFISFADLGSKTVLDQTPPIGSTAVSENLDYPSLRSSSTLSPEEINKRHKVNKHIRSRIPISDKKQGWANNLSSLDDRLFGLTNQTLNASRFSQKKKTEAPSVTHFSNFRKFLDFQNPIFSKIYAPIFQPQGLNLMSFLYNSFLNVIPDSILNSPSISSFGSFSGTRDIELSFKNGNPFSRIHEFPDSLKNSKKTTLRAIWPISNLPAFSLDENFQANTKKQKMFNRLYSELPVDGIHANLYPWITQNADSRWSKSSDLFKELANVSDLNSDGKTVLVSDSMALPKKSLLHDRNLWRRNSNSQLYFTEKPSYIKKPLIFFSSFRHLPYFFISETLSIKDVTFPQTNLSLFPSFSKSGSAFRFNPGEKIPWKMVKDNVSTYINFSIPEYSLFNQNVLKQNQKKITREPWKGYLQHKSFSLKPLSTFVKKGIGYEARLFFKKSKNCFINKEKFYQKTDLEIPPSLRTSCLSPLGETNKKDQVLSDRRSLTSIQSNRWKIFPPLFQPFTFRFIDLNLPRNWSSELFTSMFKTQTPFMNWKKEFKQKNQETLSQTEKDDLSESFSPIGVSKRNTDAAPPVGFQQGAKRWSGSGTLFQTTKWNIIPKNFFRFPIPLYFSDFFNFSAFALPQPNIPMLYGNNQSNNKSFPLIDEDLDNKNTGFYESAFALTDFSTIDKSKQIWNNNPKFEKKHRKTNFNETLKSQDSKIIVYGEKPLLKNRTAHGPPLKNQKESISLPNYLKNITNQNYQNLCPNNLNEFYFVFWILFNKTLFIYLSLHYLRKFISFLGTEYIRNLFKIFVTMKFIDGNILSIIKTFQDFNFQLNQQNVIDIKVNKQLKNIKRN